MKLFTLGIALALALPASAATFKTLSANGNSTAGAQVCFPVADSSSTMRIVSVNYSNDTAAGTLSFSGGATALSIVATNAATTSVTNLVNSTNGLSASAIVVLQHLGVCYPATVSSWAAATNYIAASTNGAASGGTNIVLTSGGFGVATSIGDDVFIMDTPVTIPVKAESSAQNGDAIYSAALSGRPILVKLGTASTTNKLYSVVSKSE